MRIAFLGNACNFAYWFAAWGQAMGYDTHAVIESDPLTPRDLPDWEDPDYDPSAPPPWVHTYRVGSPAERAIRGAADPGLKAVLASFDGVTTMTPAAAIAADALGIAAVHHTIGLFAYTASWSRGVAWRDALNPRRWPTVARFRGAMARSPRIVVSTPMEYADVGASPFAAKCHALPIAYDAAMARAHLRQHPSPAGDGTRTLLMPARQQWGLKGNDTMLRAIGSLSAAERADTRIEIVDWGVDAGRTRALVEALGLSPVTTFRPLLTKTELWEACGRAGTIVIDQVPPYPVHGGGIGGVARDALAVGAVVVTHAAPDAQRHIFGTPPPVWHVEPTVGSVAEAVRGALAMSDAERAARGQRGTEWMDATGDYHAVLPRYVDVHRELAGGAP